MVCRTDRARFVGLVRQHELLASSCAHRGWNRLFDWLSYRFAWVRRLLAARPLTLISDGKMQLRNRRKEMISQEELMAPLREQGIEKVDQVRLAVMESDGQISVVKNGA